ncbi:MAG TPA: hypothetical protein O0Y06_02465 [Methanocorpusculum sp.]|nr:hypothetical protein [Methanocorpusculum sp.]HJK79748.1 hypothetical protein [Methanocorpusculum sp.]
MFSCDAAADEVWIAIDPIQQPQTDETYIITGSTNIPADTAIVLKIYRYDAALPTPDEKEIQNLPAAFTTTIVIDGDDLVRNWSVNGPQPESLPAGNYGYIAAACLLYDEDNLLAVASLPKPDIWAAAYPVFNRVVGDAVRISGTTNIPEGETIRVEVAAPISGQKPVFQQDATVASGDGGTNTWTVVMDTAGFSPGIYAVTLSSVLHQQGPNFRLNPAADVSPWWISFDPLYDQSIGVSFSISGATNLPAGTPLDIVVQSAGLSVAGPDYPKAFTGTAMVQEGGAGINFWSITAEIQSVHEDRYEITVTEPETKTKVWNYVSLYRSAAVPQDAFWITMNEVQTPGADEPYVFSGSTTLPLGTGVTLDVRRIDATVSGIPDDLSSCPKIYSMSAVVIAGENGVNHWTTTSAVRPTQLSEKNVRYLAVAYPQEFSRIPPVTRTIPGSGTWTTVDPIPGGAVIGDLLTFSGKTTYPPGEWIIVEMYPVPWQAKPDQKPAEAVFSEKVMIDQNSRWSVMLDTANLSMDTYTILADDAPYLSGPIFSLGTAAKHLWVAVDPVPLVRKGDNFTLSGTTGLDAGNQLLIEITPHVILKEERAYDSRSYSSSSGMVQVVRVMRGEDGTNVWSVPVHTEKWKADTYEVKVMGLEVDMTHREEFVLYPADYIVPVPETTTPASPGFLFIAGVSGVIAAALFLRR